MNHVSRTLGSLAIGAAILLAQIAPLSSAQAPPVNVPGIDKPVIVVTGEINGHRELDQQLLLRPARCGLRA